MSSRRLSPKEIKRDLREDEFRSVTMSFFDRLLENWQKVAVGLGVVVALGLALFGFKTYLDHQRDKAADELVGAMRIYEAPITEGGASPDDPQAPSFASEEARRSRAKESFGAIRGRTGSGVNGDVAGLYLARIAMEEGDTETARRLWTSFVDEHPDHLLGVSARLNMIALDRREGRAEEVAASLREELDKAGEHVLPADVLLFELGQTLDQLERKEEAVELYQRLVDEFPRSPYAGRARQRTTAVDA